MMIYDSTDNCNVVVNLCHSLLHPSTLLPHKRFVLELGSHEAVWEPYSLLHAAEMWLWLIGVLVSSLALAPGESSSALQSPLDPPTR